MPGPVEEKAHRFTYPYTRQAIEWIGVALFAGIVLAILGIAASLVAWSWGLI